MNSDEALIYDDFITEFSNREITQVPLESMNGRKIYLRSLSMAEKRRWQSSMKIIAKQVSNFALRLDSSDANFLEVWDNNVQNSDDYLIKNSVANSDGTLMFDSDNKFKEFMSKVKSDSLVCEEIAHKIVKFNKLDKVYDFEEELKKNNES